MDTPLTLERFEFHRMTSTPRPYAEPNDAEREDVTDDRIAAQLFAGLTAAHAGLTEDEDGAFAVAWDRLPGTRDLRVLVGGAPYLPGAQRDRGDGEVPVLYPPGSRGRRVPTAQLIDEWKPLVWRRCVGRPDPLWTPANGSGAKVPGRGGFEDYVAHLRGGFCWFVVARPTSQESVDAEIRRLNRELPGLRRKEGSETDRIAVLRGEARYRELARAEAAGLWSVHILVGGSNETSVNQAARLLCSSSDLDELPYAVKPLRRTYVSFDEALRTTEPASDGYSSPFAATSELLAAVARPPRRELAGIRVTEPPVFDQTPERVGNINIGTILDDADQAVGDYFVPLDTLNRHTFVAGATGSGKSQTVRQLLEGLHGENVPWLVIEPAKAEYARMAGRINDIVTVIRPGDPDAVPVGLNPLEPEPGFPLQTHIDLIRALFLAAFDAEEPFPQVLAKALNRAYTDLGWNTVVGRSNYPLVTPRFPRIYELREAALQVVNDIGYGQEVADNVRG
ncbi:helicase HerA-like domain-containing protein, partial [Nocardia salmonicida]|uniref:helicase HerA-like domain-containing protein n=1 Tax=Nocardia salmonicida TaxID=53431 RepID=UPI003657AC8A